MHLGIQDISMTYPNGKKALSHVSLDIQSPNLIGLIGPNGAGKTTLMKLLVAALLPTEGRILLDGKPLIPQENALKAKLGYLPQAFGLYDELTVWQFLDYMAALKGTSGSRAAIEQAMGEANLTEHRKARIGTLSGGQRQRVGIAQALLGHPALLILDEPTVGLDPEERINFRNLFSRTAQDKIVLLSTHIIEDVQSICNRLIVIHHGRVLFDGLSETLIAAAQGHVGVMDGADGQPLPTDSYAVTARVNTAHGVVSRIVSECLPADATPAEPTLEDAYMYLLETQDAVMREVTAS